MNTVIWGAGLEGLAAANLMLSKGHTVTVADEMNQDRPLDLSAEIAFAGGKSAGDALLNAELVVCSPGIPGVHPLRKELAVRSVPVTSLANMWMESYGAKTIGVTGTKGKSTTTTLTAALLKAAGKNAHIAGNIGVALDTLPESSDFATVELSSYQCASLHTAPKVAVVTSLYSDHLPWHGSEEQYLRDKLRIIRDGCKTLVCDAETLAKIKSVSDVMPENVILADDAAVLRATQAVQIAKASVMPQNLALAMVAVESVLGRELTDAEIVSALNGFEPLPHRLQLVSKARGLRWIDDTLSTVPESVIVALQAFAGDVVLLAGGFDRGIDYAKLDEYLLNRDPKPQIVTVPTNGTRIAAAYAKHYPELVHNSESLADAVKIASDIAPDNAAVLLSPGAPSHDFFRNYADKSAHFVQAIKDLGQ